MGKKRKKSIGGREGTDSLRTKVWFLFFSPSFLSQLLKSETGSGHGRKVIWGPIEL